MIRMINVPRNTLIVNVLLVFILFSPVAVAAKHIIVIYDVSGSMISLRIGGNVNTYMESEDIRRVNKYLTNLLFTNTSQPPIDMDDTLIKACEAAYVGKPLYQSGDILTYAEYAKRRNTKLNRAKVSRTEFQRQLPDPTKLKSSFPGMVSYLLRAEVEAYDDLYSEDDDETYWVFVTDGDIDNSGKSDPGISSVLKRHAEIEGEFYAPMIFGILVNNHVRIQIRRLQKRGDINSIFIATPTKPKEQVRKIQLSRDDEGRFITETLTIDTENSAKAKFKLNNVNVEIIDRFNKPLLGILVPPVPLNDNPPPYEFRIPFPAQPEIAAPGNALKLEVTYNYNGEDEVYSVPLMNYRAVIDSIYIAMLAAPDRPAKQLDLTFSEGRYNADLTIQSESPNKDAFQIDEIRCQIQYKDARKLCDVSVPKTVARLGEPFRIEVPKQDHLDWYGNQLVFEIDYRYDGEAISTTMQIPYKLQGGGAGFPMWLLWILLIPVILVIVILLVRSLKPLIVPPPIEHHISLTEVSESGTGLEETKFYTLKDNGRLEFGSRGPKELQFDVGSEAFLYCDRKNRLLFADHDEDEERILDLPETLTVSQGEEDSVHIRCEVVADSSEGPPEEKGKPIFDPNPSDRNPLDV